MYAISGMFQAYLCNFGGLGRCIYLGITAVYTSLLFCLAKFNKGVCVKSAFFSDGLSVSNGKWLYYDQKTSEHFSLHSGFVFIKANISATLFGKKMSCTRD